MGKEFDISLFPDFDNFEEIGRGGFAKVYSAYHIQTGIKVAIKFIPKENIKSEFNLKNFKRELEYFQQLDHPFIAHFVKYIETPTSFYIVMEIAAHGSLLQKINDTGYISISEIRRIFIEIVSVLIYLHQIKKIVHRDIKLENILFDEFDHVKIVDFGLCTQMENEGQTFKSLCGSYPYAAPEIFQKIPYTEKVDIWSLGIVLYAMVCGTLPFEDPHTANLIRMIVLLDPEWPETDPDLLDLMQKMLKKNYQERISIEEIINHPFVKEGGNYTYYLGNSFNNSSFYKVIPILGLKLDTVVTKQIAAFGLEPSKIFKNGSEERQVYLIARSRIVTRLADEAPEKHFINETKIRQQSQAINSYMFNSNHTVLQVGAPGSYLGTQPRGRSFSIFGVPRPGIMKPIVGRKGLI